MLTISSDLQHAVTIIKAVCDFNPFKPDLRISHSCTIRL